VGHDTIHHESLKPCWTEGKRLGGKKGEKKIRTKRVKKKMGESP
jgi:hypothetical protein